MPGTGGQPLHRVAECRVSLAAVAAAFHASPGVAHKADLAALMRGFGDAVSSRADAPGARVGDDAAAIPDGEGYLLLAIEGFLNTFVEAEPWFAGYCGVMVNLSDIYAMGGRPLAVVDALWSVGAPGAEPLVQGMTAAARSYGVPIVGGHSNLRSDRAQLAVAILGRAGRRLLSSFDARPGDMLLLAMDLRGHYHEPYPWWDASTEADGARLREDLAILPSLAEEGLCRAAKDVSNAGILGTVLMLLECSGVGAVVDLDQVPAPPGVDPSRWLVSTFPSYGFVLAVDPQQAAAVAARFHARHLACAVIGCCDDGHTLVLRQADACLPVWDLQRQPLTGCGPRGPSRPQK